MACRIIRNTNNEIETVYTENGQESNLYNELSESGLNRWGATASSKQIKDKALELYATKDTQLFKEWLSTVESVQRDSNNEVDSKHLYDYASHMASEQALGAVANSVDNSIARNLSEMLNIEDEFIQNNRPVLVEYLNKQLPGVDFTIKDNGNITVLNPKTLSSTYDASTVQQVFDKLPAIVENLQNVETKLMQLGNRLGVQVKFDDQVKYTKKDGTKATVKSTANSYLKLINITKGADIKNLTEEMAHIVVDSLEAANSPLFTSMYNNITKHKIYDEVSDAYSTLYSNDTRMIKKEAMAQAIMQTIINDSMITDNPFDSRFRRWWNKVMEFLSTLYSRIFMDPYVKASHLMLEDAVEQTDVLVNEYYARQEKDPEATKEPEQQAIQKTEKSIQPLVDKLQKHNDALRIEAVRAEDYEGIAPELAQEDGKVDRYVGEQNDVFHGMTIIGRPSDDTQKNFIKKVGKNKAIEINDNPYNIIKRQHGTEGHKTLELISKAISSSNKKAGIEEARRLSPQYTKGQFDKLQRAVEKVHRIAQETEDTIPGPKGKKPTILLENTIVNSDNNPTVAGSVDVLVIYSDNTAGIFDWKFITPQRDPYVTGYGASTKLAEFPFLDKLDSYDIQVGHYKNMLTQNYNVSRIRQSRIVPIHVRFKYDKVNKQFTNEVVLLQEGTDSQYLEQLPVANELTNITTIDKLIDQQIRTRRDKLISYQTARPQERDKLKLQIDKLTQNIQSLQVRHDVATTIEAGVSLVNEVNNRIDENDEILKDGTINVKYIKTNELLDMRERLAFYDSIMDAHDYMELVKINDKKLYDKIKSLIEKHAAAFGLTKTRIQMKLDERAIELGKNRGVQVNKLSRELGFRSTQFLNLSQIQEPAFEALYKLVDSDNNKTRKLTNDLVEEVEMAQRALQEDSSLPNGVAVYDLILNPKTNNLQPKYKKEFWEERTDAVESKNWKFFKEHYKLKDDYKELLQHYKDLAFDAIDLRFPDTIDEKGKVVGKVQEKKRAAAKERWLKRFDVVNQPETAWLNKSLYLIADLNDEVMEKHITQEYDTIRKNINLKNFYDLHVSKMLEFKKILGAKYGHNFVGHIHRDILDSVFHGNLSASSLYESMMDSLQVREHNLMYGQRDMKTGELKKSIPKLFLIPLKDANDNIDVSLKSKDLGKSLVLMGTAAYNYKHKSETLDEALTLEAMLQNNSFGETMRTEAGEILQNLSGGFESRRTGTPAKNLEAFQKFMNYYYYGAQKSSKDVRRKIGNTTISTDRSIAAARNYLALKYLGLAIVPGVATYLGGRVNMMYQAVKGRHVTKKGVREATKKGFAMDDTYRAFSEHFEVYQSDLKMRKANELSNNSATKILTHDNFFSPYRLADEALDRDVLYSMALNHGIDKEGKIRRLSQLPKDAKSLVELATVKSNKNWKKGSVMNKFNLEIEGLSEEQYVRFRNMSRKISRLVKGSMSSEDTNLVNTSTLGQAMMQFKNWMPGTMEARFGKLEFDVILESFEEGNWKSWSKDQILLEGELQSYTALVAKNVMRLGWEIATFSPYHADEKKMRFHFDNYVNEMVLLGDQKFIDALANPEALETLYADFVEMKRSNIKGFAAELRTVLLFLMSIMFIGGDFDDDGKADYRETWLGRTAYRLLNRTYLEVGYYADLGEMQRILTAPMPIVRFGVDLYRLFANTKDELSDSLFGENATNDPTPYFYYGSDWVPGFNQVGGFFEVFKQDEEKTR